MADDHAAVAQEMSVGARIGGPPTVVTLVSVAHAFSHAYGALLPLIVPFFLTDLQLTYTQLGLIFSLSNLVWSPLQLGFGVLGRYYSRKLILGLGHVCQGAVDHRHQHGPWLWRPVELAHHRPHRRRPAASHRQRAHLAGLPMPTAGGWHWPSTQPAQIWALWPCPSRWVFDRDPGLAEHLDTVWPARCPDRHSAPEPLGRKSRQPRIRASQRCSSAPRSGPCSSIVMPCSS